MSLESITRGATLNLEVTRTNSFYKPLGLTERDGTVIDLTGYSGRAQMRDRASNALLAEFDVTIDDPETGIVVIRLTVTQTTALTLAGGVWDIKLILDADAENNTHTIAGGSVTVVQSVTDSA